jgi:hypothetical protein
LPRRRLADAAIRRHSASAFIDGFRIFIMVMPRLSLDLAPRMSSEQRRAASVAGVAHALHDGYTDLIYIMLPLWQAEFGLTYDARGLLRSMFAGAMASLQIPSGFLAE